MCSSDLRAAIRGRPLGDAGVDQLILVEGEALGEKRLELALRHLPTLAPDEDGDPAKHLADLGRGNNTASLCTFWL